MITRKRDLSRNNIYLLRQVLHEPKEKGSGKKRLKHVVEEAGATICVAVQYAKNVLLQDSQEYPLHRIFYCTLDYAWMYCAAQHSCGKVEGPILLYDEAFPWDEIVIKTA